MQRYDFGSGRTDPLSFPSEALAQAAAAAIPAVGGDLVLYPGDLGHAGARVPAPQEQLHGRRQDASLGGGLVRRVLSPGAGAHGSPRPQQQSCGGNSFEANAVSRNRFR